MYIKINFRTYVKIITREPIWLIIFLFSVVFTIARTKVFTKDKVGNLDGVF